MKMMIPVFVQWGRSRSVMVESGEMLDLADWMCLMVFFQRVGFAIQGVRHSRPRWFWMGKMQDRFGRHWSIRVAWFRFAVMLGDKGREVRA